MFRLKRAYEPASPDDGCRILVERLWPRGVSKDRAAIDLWLKDIAPSAALRKWYGHDPDRWTEFRRRYWAELRSDREAVSELRTKGRGAKVTLVYAAHDEEHSGALALKQFLSRPKRPAVKKKRSSRNPK
ncbi:MAG TPA: DUF488 family protein [Pirellulales bacterium]|nr:DUF488 family protein [Pirellulales bacterium]